MGLIREKCKSKHQTCLVNGHFQHFWRNISGECPYLKQSVEDVTWVLKVKRKSTSNIAQGMCTYFKVTRTQNDINARIKYALIVSFSYRSLISIKAELVFQNVFH